MAKSIFSKNEADKIAVAHSPRKFPAVITEGASSFVAFHSERVASGLRPSFQIDKIVAQQTGVAELERRTIEQQVEEEALGRLKELEEQAYHEAYQLGLEEGREKAFTENQAAMQAKFDQLETLLVKIDSLKSDLASVNEAHIMRLIFYMAKRLTLDEVKYRQDMILTVVKQAIESAQTEEIVTVRLSTRDFSFIEEIKERLGKEFDLVKRAKYEMSDSISDGGCVVGTNYGEIDATIEQRMEKLWAAVSEKLPKVTDVIGDAAGGSQS